MAALAQPTQNNTKYPAHHWVSQIGKYTELEHMSINQLIK